MRAADSPQLNTTMQHTLNSITLEALRAFPQQLAAHYAAIPTGFEHWAPPSWDGVPSEPFTAIEQVCHVRDIEIDGYHVRLQRTLLEDNPVLASLDSERLARERDYAGAGAEQVLRAFAQARAATLEMIAGLRQDQLDRPARFEGYGALTLRSLIHYLCSHDQLHLAGLQWLLAQIEASRVTSPSS
jgi:hypothetical protein